MKTKRKEPELDIEQVLKNLKFCPCDVTIKGKKILATRCWNWFNKNVRPTRMKEFRNTIISNVTDHNGELTIYNMDTGEFETYKIPDIESCNLSNYKGQMYLD